MKDRDRIIEVFRKCKKGVLSLNGLLRKLGYKKKRKPHVHKLVRELEKEGILVEVAPGRFALSERLNLVRGKIQRFRDGFGFLLMKEGPDIFIPPPFMKGALTGDEVLVRVMRKKVGGKPEGRVVKILKRERKEFIGTFRGSKRGGVIIPDEEELPAGIPVKKGDVNGAKDGYKVVFALKGGRKSSARVIEVIGREGDPKIDVIIVIKKYRLPTEFPNEVLDEAKRLSGRISPKIKKRRVDLRGELIFTIDPDDAKDFDDAISIKKTERGYSLGVHVADVSYYVKEGSGIDLEARDRGTSIYLIDTVIPMLPHRLSSNLCSLMPGKDRLTVSVLLDFDRDGNLIKRQFLKSIIRSKARLTYREAQLLLEVGELPEEHISIIKGAEIRKIKEALHVARELARRLREKRWERGSLDFDLPEPEITLLPTGEVKEIKPQVRLETHMIIEDFMIAANEAVAQFLNENEIPTIYRIHEPPNPEKIREFLELASSIIGEHFEVESPTPKLLQGVLEKVRGREEEPLLNYLLLRSLMRARYSVENRGHFGLATNLYLHFTSPIRRYPDLVVHRILKDFLSGRARKDGEWIAYLESTAQLASMREERAEMSEFELIDLKKLEYMKNRLGDVFEGIITHVGPNGFFVELKENLTEGFVSIENLKGDFYFDRERYALVERRGRKAYRIGQTVKVIVVRVEKYLKRMDLFVIEP